MLNAGCAYQRSWISKPRLGEARSGCHHFWMPFGQVQISSHGLTSNDDVQLIHTTESHGYHSDIRNYRWGYLRLNADD